MFNTAMSGPLLHRSQSPVLFPWLNWPRSRSFWIWYNNMGDAWKWILNNEFPKRYFHRLANFIDNEMRDISTTIYPPAELVFSWTRYCSPDSVKVVILGQDPYHEQGEAHGLSFSVQDGVHIPSSLDNIYKALMSDIPGFKRPGHGSLIGWAKQGVLLLNTCLTVREGDAKSHQDKGWEIFTNALLSYLSSNYEKLVFMLWGKEAKKKGALIEQYENHLILKHCHPSPKAGIKGGKFLGCKHFSECNNYLIDHNKTPIDWNWLPTPKSTLPEVWNGLPIDNTLNQRYWDYSYSRMVLIHWMQLRINWDWLPLYWNVCLDGFHHVWQPVDWSWLSIDWSGVPIGGPRMPNTGIYASSDPLFNPGNEMFRDRLE